MSSQQQPTLAQPQCETIFFPVLSFPWQARRRHVQQLQLKQLRLEKGRWRHVQQLLLLLEKRLLQLKRRLLRLKQLWQEKRVLQLKLLGLRLKLLLSILLHVVTELPRRLQQHLPPHSAARRRTRCGSTMAACGGSD